MYGNFRCSQYFQKEFTGAVRKLLRSLQKVRRNFEEIWRKIVSSTSDPGPGTIAPLAPSLATCLSRNIRGLQRHLTPSIANGPLPWTECPLNHEQGSHITRWLLTGESKLSRCDNWTRWLLTERPYYPLTTTDPVGGAWITPLPLIINGGVHNGPLH